MKDQISPVITYFINSCVKNTEYPDKLKNLWFDQYINRALIKIIINTGLLQSLIWLTQQWNTL